MKIKYTVIFFYFYAFYVAFLFIKIKAPHKPINDLIFAPKNGTIIIDGRRIVLKDGQTVLLQKQSAS